MVMKFQFQHVFLPINEKAPYITFLEEIAFPKTFDVDRIFSNIIFANSSLKGKFEGAF